MVRSRTKRFDVEGITTGGTTAYKGTCGSWHIRGPTKSGKITALPTGGGLTTPSSEFRLLLLGRRRMPMPLGPLRCFCWGFTWAPNIRSSGQHSIAPGMCRGFGVPKRTGPGRQSVLEVVVCNGPPLWHGAQIAVDAIIVNPVSRDGSPLPGADDQPGSANSGSTARPILACARAVSCCPPGCSGRMGASLPLPPTVPLPQLAGAAA